MGNEQWTFTRKAMNYVHEQIVMKRFDEVNRLLNKIKQYQQKECGEALPSASRFKAEKLYNQFDYSKPIAILCLCIGLFAFIYYCRCTVTEKNICCSLAFIFNLLLCSIFIYLSMTIVLRGYVSTIFLCPTVLKQCSSWLGAQSCLLFFYSVNSPCQYHLVSCCADLHY